MKSSVGKPYKINLLLLSRVWTDLKNEHRGRKMADVNLSWLSNSGVSTFSDMFFEDMR